MKDIKSQVVSDIPASRLPELVQLIRQIHPVLQVLGTMDETTYSNISKLENNYFFNVVDDLLQAVGTLTQDVASSIVQTVNVSDLTRKIVGKIQVNYWKTSYPGSGTIQLLDSNNNILATSGSVPMNWSSYYGYNIANAVVLFTLSPQVNVSSYSIIKIKLICDGGAIGVGYSDANPYAGGQIEGQSGNDLLFKIQTSQSTSGSIYSNAIASDYAVLSFYKQLKMLVSNGGSTHATPVQAKIYGNADSYAAALNATGFTISPTDPRIILKRDALDIITASSASQTVWNMTVAGGMAALPNHGTILATEIGVASVLVVEKSILGDFSDTVVLAENTDYVVDYSTRTATKITLTSGTGIVNAQSKLRLSWIADVMKIDGATNNTALKLRLYLNRTSIDETSPNIQPIPLGSAKYAEMLYGT